MLYVSSVAVIMHDLEELSSLQRSYLAVAISVGFVFGCYFSGTNSDRFGRVYCFKRFIVANLLGVFGLLCSCSYTLILCFLFILGFGGGCDSVLANTVALESFPPSKASKVTLLSVAWSLGSSFSYAVALVAVWFEVQLLYPWRCVICVAAVYTVCAAIERLWLVETPTFILENRPHEYDQTIEHIYRVNGKIRSQQAATTEPLLDSQAADLKKEVQVPFVQALKSTRTMVLGVVYFFSSFGYSSLMFFMPIFLPISSQVQSYTIILVQQLSGVPGKLLATYAVDTALGRKGTSALAFTLTGASLVPFVYFDQFMVLLCCTSFYYMVVNMGLSALFTHAQELYQGKTRSRACGFLMGLARVGSSVGPLLAGILYEFWGVSVAVLVNASLFAMVGVLYLKLAETRPRLHLPL